MKKLIYIAGSGRSGSTVLERIFHSIPGVFALGEFHCLWRLPADKINCSSGQTFDQSPFWQAVSANAGIDETFIEEMRRLESETCRTGFVVKNKYDLKRIRENENVQRFLEMQSRIFNAICEQTGADTLIDSSKAGPRAWIMAADPRVDVWHLWRDPVDVLSSWRSKKFDPGLGTAMQRLSFKKAAEDWAKIEHFLGKLSKQHTVQKINYQTLCERPKAVCADLINATFENQQAGSERTPAWVDRSTFEPAGGYHTLNGNPDRFSEGPITISYRSADKSKLSFVDKVGVRIAGSLLEAIYPAPR